MKILQVGLGALGRLIGDDLKMRHIEEIVGIVDPAIDGMLPDLNAGDHCQEIDVAIVTTSTDLGVCADTFRAPLNRRLPVVSTCEELAWP